MKIESMTAAHLDGVLRIENDCFSHPWSRQSLENEWQNGTSRFFVAVEEDCVLGYIGMSVVLDEGYIFNIAVDGQHRNRGIGSALLQRLVMDCQKHHFAFLTLEVRESNASAIALYNHFGFVKVGERHYYYSDPIENALLMTKFFNQT